MHFTLSVCLFLHWPFNFVVTPWPHTCLINTDNRQSTTSSKQYLWKESANSKQPWCMVFGSRVNTLHHRDMVLLMGKLRTRANWAPICHSMYKNSTPWIICNPIANKNKRRAHCNWMSDKTAGHVLMESCKPPSEHHISSPTPDGQPQLLQEVHFLNKRLNGDNVPQSRQRSPKQPYPLESRSWRDSEPLRGAEK